MEIEGLNPTHIRTSFNGSQEYLNIEVVEAATSTNDIAKERLTEQPDNISLIATNKQTAGRGRSGKAFYSELQHGLYFTLAFTPNVQKIEQIPLYTLLTAAALVEVLEQYVTDPLAIKWVNDIFYQGKKVSGILSEMVSNLDNKDVPGIVVGVGVNLAGDFEETDEQVQFVAGTLFGVETPADFNQNTFLSEFLNQFLLYHQSFPEKNFMSSYEDHLLGIGKEVHYLEKGQEKSGIIQGINEHGHLLVLRPDQSISTLYGQEVHFNSKQFINES